MEFVVKSVRSNGTFSDVSMKKNYHKRFEGLNKPSKVGKTCKTSKVRTFVTQLLKTIKAVKHFR